jgi:TATA-box binding protein (TBP) (component of TFIID and TFIIIB)
VRFSTISACFTLSQRVNLHILAKYVPGGNCIYGMSDVPCPQVERPKKRLAMENTASMCMRLTDSTRGESYNVGISIFANGQVVVMGSRKYEDVLLVSQRLISRVQRTVGEDADGRRARAVACPDELELAPLDGADENGIRIEMVKSEFDLGVRLKLGALFTLFSNSGLRVMYDPEQFPGVKVKPTAGVFVALYQSGKGFITSGKTSRAAAFGEWDAPLDAAYGQVAGLVWEHLADVVNLDSAR